MEEIYKNTYQYILSFESHHTLKVDRMTHHFTDGETEAQRGRGIFPRLEEVGATLAPYHASSVLPTHSRSLVRYPE